MLAQLKGPGEVEAEVLMMRQVHIGSFLIVEGEDDSKFWAAWIRRPQCEIVIGGGKQAVVGAVSRLDTRGFAGAVGVVDDDCDTLLGRTVTSTNLCVTHARDLEGVVLQTSALSRVVAEYGDAKKVAACERSRTNVAAALLENCLHYGRLRWLAYRDQIPIDFKPLSPARFVVVNTWTVDVSSLHAAVVGQGHFRDADCLDAALATLGAVDPWLVVQGHDLVHVLSIGLARVLGAKAPGQDKVATALRLAVDRTEIATTKLWAALQDWERGNPPYVVLV